MFHAHGLSYTFKKILNVNRNLLQTNWSRKIPHITPLDSILPITRRQRRFTVTINRVQQGQTDENVM
jgi:hypothetical protein